MSVLAVVVAGMGSSVAVAQPEPEPIPDTGSISLVPAPGTEFVVDDDRYRGRLDVTAHDDGLSLVEQVPLDGYLAGIAEVPFSWPQETLRAQAVAARTYLAWTLAGGRSGSGAAYGFDICATDQCQVYAGAGLVDQPDGERWMEAVDATAGQILLFDGAPALALYSSSAGSRTRPVQDIFGGDPKPYLVGAPSPEAEVTPFARWEVSVELGQFRAILAATGYPIGGRVDDITVATPPIGEGTASVVVASGVVGSLDRVVIPVAEIRRGFNRYGPALFPWALPAPRADGLPLPQAIPSYTFTIHYIPPPVRGLPRRLPADDLEGVGRVTFVGEGWGHSVGMSQYGAYALGLRGETAAGILAHFYNGLVPQDGARFVPDQVRVGLDWGEDMLHVVATGPFQASGVTLDAGDWQLTDQAGLVRLRPADHPVFDPDGIQRLRLR